MKKIIVRFVSWLVRYYNITPEAIYPGLNTKGTILNPYRENQNVVIFRSEYHSSFDEDQRTINNHLMAPIIYELKNNHKNLIAISREPLMRFSINEKQGYKYSAKLEIITPQ